MLPAVRMSDAGTIPFMIRSVIWCSARLQISGVADREFVWMSPEEPQLGGPDGDTEDGLNWLGPISQFPEGGRWFGHWFGGLTMMHFDFKKANYLGEEWFELLEK